MAGWKETADIRPVLMAGADIVSMIEKLPNKSNALPGIYPAFHPDSLCLFTSEPVSWHSIIFYRRCLSLFVWKDIKGADMPVIHGMHPGAEQAWCGAVDLDAASYSVTLVTCPRCQVAMRGSATNALEHVWMQSVLDQATYLGYLSYHTLDSRGSAPGWPDLCLVRPAPGGGLCYMWELKTRRGKVTREQQRWLAALHGKTIDARVVRPGDMRDITRWLQGEGEGA
jgi:hypothetical protein